MNKNLTARRLPVSTTGIAMAALGAGLLAPSAFASLSVYEGFSYTSAANLNGQNGGSGFSGAWSTVSGSPTIGTPSLTYTGLTVTGLRADTTAATTQVSRGLTTAPGANGTTTFFSFLLKPNNTTAAATAELSLIGNLGNLNIGKSATTDTSHYLLETGTAGAGTGQVATGVSYVSGTTVMLVLRADFATGNDTFKLYVNPSYAAEPGSADATKSGFDLGTSMSSIQINGNLGFSIDEIKIGSTYADVVPEPSTYAAAFAVAGIVSIAWLRRRSDAKRA